MAQIIPSIRDSEIAVTLPSPFKLRQCPSTALHTLRTMGEPNHREYLLDTPVRHNNIATRKTLGDFHLPKLHDSVAQLVEQRTFNP